MTRQDMTTNELSSLEPNETCSRVESSQLKALEAPGHAFVVFLVASVHASGFAAEVAVAMAILVRPFASERAILERFAASQWKFLQALPATF